jgi:uncharacterized glyoxalase superfamily protein PhnB
MSEYPKFSLAFNIASNNEDRMKAFELYQEAFGAVKAWEGTPPDGDDLHIVMQINGFNILLGPGSEKNEEHIVTPELMFDNEDDLRKAYNILKQEGCNYSIGSYPWAPIGALVTDKYGVTWWLRT